MVNNLLDKNVKVITNPLIKTKILALRNKSTLSWELEKITEQLVFLASNKIFENETTKKRIITAPFGNYCGQELANEFVFFPILRAGEKMISPFHALFPKAKFYHFGIKRNEISLKANFYYLPAVSRFPNNLNKLTIVLLDPVIATANTIILALNEIKKHTLYNEALEKKIKIFSFLIYKKSIKEIKKLHPEVEIYTLEIEEKLNEKGYLIPGIGDIGDRFFNTIE